MALLVKMCEKLLRNLRSNNRMRHRKRRSKLNKTTAHRRCLFANMLKSLILHGKVRTTVAKGKELKSRADKLITLAKRDNLSAVRKVVSWLMLEKPEFDRKELRKKKEALKKASNTKSGKKTTATSERPFIVGDNKVIANLFFDLQGRFKDRKGGYTRLIHDAKPRQGDATSMCFIEILS